MLLHLPPEIVEIIIRHVAVLPSPFWWENEVLWQRSATDSGKILGSYASAGAYIPPLKALRLTCQYFARHEQLKDNLFSAIQLFFDPLHVDYLNSGFPDSLLSYIRTLILYSPWSDWYKLKRDPYKHLVQHARQLPSSFLFAPSGISKVAWHAYIYSEEEITAGWLAYQDHCSLYSKMREESQIHKIWAPFAAKVPGLRSICLRTPQLHCGKFPYFAVPLKTLAFVPSMNSQLQRLLFRCQEKWNGKHPEWNFRNDININFYPSGIDFDKAATSILMNREFAKLDLIEMKCEYAHTYDFFRGQIISAMTASPKLIMDQFSYQPQMNLETLKILDDPTEHRHSPVWPVGNWLPKFICKLSSNVKDLYLHQGHQKISSIFPLIDEEKFPLLQRLSVEHTVLDPEQFSKFIELAPQLTHLNCRNVRFGSRRDLSPWKGIFETFRKTKRRILINLVLTQLTHCFGMFSIIDFEADLRRTRFEDSSQYQQNGCFDSYKWIKSEEEILWKIELLFFLVGRLEWSASLDKIFR